MDNKMKVHINPDRCKACGYCIKACPKSAIEVSDYVNEKGYNAIKVIEDKCITCGICYKVCPDYVFEIK